MIEDCTALVLAGGESQRMGCDKASLRLGEQTLLQNVIAVMQKVFPEVLVSVRRPRPEIALPQVCDAYANAGPLAGLCAGLARAHTPWVFAVATDMPFVKPALIERLAQQRAGYQAVVPVVRGYPQPLAAFYSTSCLEPIRSMLEAGGGRGLRAALGPLNVCYVDESELLAADPGLRSFFDLDTPQDVAAARRNGEWSSMENLSVGDAQTCVLQHATIRDAEIVELEASLGRVLAEEICANRDQPPCDVSAMDGFALRSADLSGTPSTLTLIEDIKAGDRPTRAVQAGQCSRIMTGAPVPSGADAVIRVEDTQMLEDGRIEIGHPVKPGNDIRTRGEHLRNGQVVLKAGTEITPGVIGVLATVKSAQVKVYRQPRVAILSTGNELEGLDEPIDPDRIPNSNSYALMAQVQALGIEPVLLGIARDDPEELAQFLRRGLGFDVLLVSGGTSVGMHDHVRPTLEALGVQMHFWRVKMRPGHPVAFGTTPGSIVFCLPGNPVSSMVCFEQFVLPALRRMMGHSRLFRRTLEARLSHPLKNSPGRTEFVRVALAHDESGNYAASSTGPQGSGALLSMALADGLLVMPATRAGLAAGESARVQLLDGTAFQNDPGFEENA
jgi:molybdopterin molybdotransferase